jgi:hypothetical protein
MREEETIFPADFFHYSIIDHRNRFSFHNNGATAKRAVARDEANYIDRNTGKFGL